MVSLKNKPQVLTPKMVECGFRQLRDIRVVDANRSLLRAKQSAQQMQKSCFTTSGLTQQKTVFPAREFKVSKPDRICARIGELN